MEGLARLSLPTGEQQTSLERRFVVGEWAITIRPSARSRSYGAFRQASGSIADVQSVVKQEDFDVSIGSRRR